MMHLKFSNLTNFFEICRNHATRKAFKKPFAKNNHRQIYEKMASVS